MKVPPARGIAPKAVKAVEALVAPVPPLAIARVPANVTAPVVAVTGVSPVVPPENEVTLAIVAQHNPLVVVEQAIKN